MNRSASSTVSASLQPRVVPFAVSPQRIDPDAAKVVKRLARSGHTAYLVGGCVRDLLLNRTPKDFDVATSARPNDVRYLFRNCRIIGRRFRLAHILFGGTKVIEVATFRRDPLGLTETTEDWETPTQREGEAEAESEEAETASNQPAGVLRRHRPQEDQDLLIRHDNVFGTPPEDAARRDFTMNALFYDLERREVIDYVGGIADIEQRVIRTIGDADVRFREDPVRILRALKFAGKLDLGIEPEVYDAMVAHRDDLMRAARPRLLEELLRLLRAGSARRTLWLTWESGVLAVLLPELSTFLDDSRDGGERLWRRLATIDRAVAEGTLPSDATLLGALTLDPAEEALAGERDLVGAVTGFYEEIQERLAIPRKLYDRLRQVVVVQKRMRGARHAALSRRDYYPEALALHTLDQGEIPGGERREESPPPVQEFTEG